MKECDSMNRMNDIGHIISIWKKKHILLEQNEKAIPIMIHFQYVIIICMLFFLCFQISKGQWFHEQILHERIEILSNQSKNREVIMRKSEEKKKPMVAFTFDDGPHPKNTKKILDVLKEHNAHATFFVIGENAKKFGNLMKEMVDSGSEVGNHSYSHQKLTNLDHDKMLKEIRRGNQIIKKQIGKKPKYLRPPYGSYNQEVVAKITQPIILWDIDTLDWKMKDTEDIIQRVLNEVEDGDIVLMHDIYESTADAVAYLVPELQKRGFEIVSISELAKEKGVKLKPGKTYRRIKKK